MAISSFVRAVITVTFVVSLSMAQADSLFPQSLVEFRPGEEVALAPRPNSWDKAFRERGSLVALDSGAIRLYYTGYDGTREGLKQIGLAESEDGGQTWRRLSDKPVSPRGLWTEDPFVCRDGDRWIMVAEGLNDQAHMLESGDGVEWTAIGPLDVRKTNGEGIPAGPYGTPTLLKQDGVWNLFYERRDQGIWLAQSTDRKVWTLVDDDPIITLGDSGFDSAMIALNQVFRHEGRFYAYYHGADRYEKPRQWAVGVAVSDDLRTWKRYDGNPITDPQMNVSSGTVVVPPGEESSPILFTTHAAIRIHQSVE